MFPRSDHLFRVLDSDFDDDSTESAIISACTRGESLTPVWPAATFEGNYIFDSPRYPG
jgi:hypothetical protein